MRYFIVLIGLFLSLTSLGQKRIEPTAYQKKMVEMSNIRMDYHLNIMATKSRIHSYRPYSWVKITFKTTVNSSVISKIRVAEMVETLESEEVSLGEALDIGFSDFDATDYMSIMAYDLRAKIYLPHHSAVVLRCFVTGIQLNTYNYTIGYSYKF